MLYIVLAFILFSCTFCFSFVIMNVVKVKLVTVVKANPKAPFSIATTPWCRGGCDFFTWIAPLYR